VNLNNKNNELKLYISPSCPNIFAVAVDSQPLSGTTSHPVINCRFTSSASNMNCSASGLVSFPPILTHLSLWPHV
jgi:hypothetical protein